MSTNNTFFATDGPLVGVNLTDVQTTADFRLGCTVTGTNNSEFEYVFSACGITAGQAVVINGCGSAFPATTALAVCMKKIGIAQTAIACGSYGWVARRGYGLSCNLVASAGATAQLYTTSTAGALGTTLVSAGGVVGGVSITAASAGGTTLATVSLGAPAVQFDRDQD
jgi:hypothetical protein